MADWKRKSFRSVVDQGAYSWRFYDLSLAYRRRLHVGFIFSRIVFYPIAHVYILFIPDDLL